MFGDVLRLVRDDPPAILTLQIPICDTVLKLNAICKCCGADAAFTCDAASEGAV